MENDSPSRGAFVVSALIMSGLLTGAWTGQAALARAHDPYAHLDLFARVFATVHTDYVDPIAPSRLIEGAIEGMLDTLDPQSRWLSAQQLQELQDDAAGTTTGIGVTVRRTPQGIEVVKVLPQSPARRDGIEPGDRIVAVDGTPLAALPTEDVSGMFDGLQGEPTSLTIVRPGQDEPVVITTEHGSVAQSAVHVDALGSVLYARIDHFQAGVAQDLDEQVRARGLPSTRGLILDLRDNPGGLLSEAVAVSDLFLDTGLIVATQSRPGASLRTDEHHATPGGFPEDLPVVVLVNGLSASASEIVASALQDTGRGTLIGETTYGKGSVQKVYTHLDPSMPDAEAALKLTVGWYTTPSGAPVASRTGRVPDIEVPYPRKTGPKGQLQRALHDLEQRYADHADAGEAWTEVHALMRALPDDPRYRADLPWQMPLDERIPRDPQLQRAIEWFED